MVPAERQTIRDEYDKLRRDVKTGDRGFPLTLTHTSTSIISFALPGARRRAMAFAATYLRNVVMKPQARNRRSLHVAHPARQRCTVCRYNYLPTLRPSEPLTYPLTLPIMWTG